MEFDVEEDLKIFNPLLEKRPEISKESLKNDLLRYYLPFAQKLIKLKKSKNSDEAVLVGVSAIQGAGKTTQGEILEILLDHFGYQTISRSIDDHYITHQELEELRGKDPRYIRRGVTHDIPLATRDLKDLKNMSSPILVSGYDKGAHKGDGDRFAWVNPVEGVEIKASVIGEGLRVMEVRFNEDQIPLPGNIGAKIPFDENILPKDLIEFLENESVVSVSLEGDEVKFSGESFIKVSKDSLPNGWRLVTKKPDFILYDGWMLGARRVEDESVFDADLPALETQESKDFAKMINQKLEQYHELWEMLDFLNVLYVPNYQISLEWREQAEEALREKGEGMSKEEIKDFVHYFWRSVHPAIHIKNLAQDEVHTNQVVIIEDNHSVGDILTPNEVKEKYP